MKLCLASAAAFFLCACTSTIPDASTMDKYYHEAEASVQRDIARLHEKLVSGEISKDEYDSRAQAIRDSVGARASKMAWARHELVEAQMRAQGIPTAGNPVSISAPNGASAGNSFFRQAGQGGGQGYTGVGANPWHGGQQAGVSGSSQF